METTIEPTFRNHFWHIALFFKEETGYTLISTKEPGANKGGCHSFRSRKLNLSIVFLTEF